MMKSLDEKTSKEERQAHAHKKGGHVGKAVHFKDTFQFLIQMGVFGRLSKAEIANNLYVDEEQIETPAMIKAGKSPTTAGERRLDGLRHGRRSFTVQEAEYFYTAFRDAVGKEWADQIELSAFIKTPIRKTITKLVRSGLPGPWDRLDPVAALRLLNAGQSDRAEKPAIHIRTVSRLRISNQGDGSLSDLKSVIESRVLKPGSELYVNIEGIPAGADFLVLEVADKPFTHSGSNEFYQSQVMGHAKVMTKAGRKHVEIGKGDAGPLEIESISGDFGYCVIVYPKGWDVEEAFGIDPGKRDVTVEDFREAVRKLRLTMLDNDTVSLALIDYHVPA